MVTVHVDTFADVQGHQFVTESLYSFCVLQRSDPQLLAQFYYADEELNQVASELDSLDGRKDPQRCTLLVNQFRSCQVEYPICFSQQPDHMCNQCKCKVYTP